jgi:hypothetical protein
VSDVYLKNLKRGTIVIAAMNLDPEGANVPLGDRGVVFEEYNAAGDKAGPLVRWLSGGVCNVYQGWVKVQEVKWP